MSWNKVSTSFWLLFSVILGPAIQHFWVAAWKKKKKKRIVDTSKLNWSTTQTACSAAALRNSIPKMQYSNFSFPLKIVNSGRGCRNCACCFRFREPEVTFQGSLAQCFSCFHHVSRLEQFQVVLDWFHMSIWGGALRKCLESESHLEGDWTESSVHAKKKKIATSCS